MTLLDSLLDAIIRLEGDALVMHVGEKPYVVTTSAAMSQYRGPLAWGQVELSSRVLTSEAVLGMLGQILPADLRPTLDQLGAIEHEVEPPAGSADRFTLVAARGGDDVFLELRRRPKVEEAAVVEKPHEPEVVAAPVETQAPAAESIQPASAAAVPDEEFPFEIVPEVLQDSPTDADVNALLMQSAAALLGPSGPSGQVEAPAVEEHETGAPLVSHVEESAGIDIALDLDDITEPDTAAVAAELAGALASELGPVGVEEERIVAADVEPPPIAAEPPDRVIAEIELPPVVTEMPLPVGANSDAQPTADIAPIETEAVERLPIEVDASQTVATDMEPPPLAAEIPQTVSTNPEAPAIAAGEGFALSDVEGPVTAEAPPHVVAEAEPQPVASEPAAPAAAAAGTFEATQPPQEREPRAVVVPIARPAGRAEPVTARGFTVEELLRVAAARGASTVYLVAQSQPMLRADGGINPLEIGSGAPLTEADVNRVVLEVAPPAAREAWHRGTAAEWVCDVADVGRVRCMTFREHRGPGVIFRMIPPRATLADQLGLTPDVRALCTQSDGLVIVTGPRASGKSTLMSAFIDLINRTSSDHVITIESQVAFAHESRRSFVSQREVRGDSDAVVSAVRGALREDPDVLLIEDLRSAEIASVAFEAADSGRLVFASVPAASTIAAVNRLLEMFPADRRAHAQASLAGTLRGVVAQVLLRGSKGGRVAAREILLNTPAVATLIEEGRTAQLLLAMESGRRHGMMPLNDALASFVRDGTIHATEAYLRAFDKEGLLAALKREGGDISFAERLA